MKSNKKIKISNYDQWIMSQWRYIVNAPVHRSGAFFLGVCLFLSSVDFCLECWDGSLLNSYILPKYKKKKTYILDPWFLLADDVF